MQIVGVPCFLLASCQSLSKKTDIFSFFPFKRLHFPISFIPSFVCLLFNNLPLYGLHVRFARCHFGVRCVFKSALPSCVQKPLEKLKKAQHCEFADRIERVNKPSRHICTSYFSVEIEVYFCTSHFNWNRLCKCASRLLQQRNRSNLIDWNDGEIADQREIRRRPILVHCTPNY